jgi:hypothetical protein
VARKFAEHESINLAAVIAFGRSSRSFRYASFFRIARLFLAAGHASRRAAQHGQLFSVTEHGLAIKPVRRRPS